MVSFLFIIVSTFIFGPLGSTPYCFSQGLSIIETAVLVSIVHAALVPIWFLILEVIRYRLIYENRLLRRITSGAWAKSGSIRARLERNAKEFERRVGQKGFGLGVVVFTFTFGVSWAALAAVMLNIKKSTIIYSIAIGAVASSVFTAVALGTIGTLLPSPWLLYLVGAGAILVIFGHQKYRERRLLHRLYRQKNL
ncbi:MAG: hypothetical protein ACP5PX_05880 [Candidatus Hadarchaeum sp.]|uniref:hypothetical protein n=1 Tax=Candidatus Hadarchaeum sp. TaxID=2883567 RepID=UPI003D0F3387